MKLSIITICRNAGDGLQRTVASVLAQSRPPCEYLIQDGGSSDQSVEALVAWLGENAGEETEDGRPKTEDCFNRQFYELCELGEEPQKTHPPSPKLRRTWNDTEGEWGGDISVGGGNCVLQIRSEADRGIYDALNRGIARSHGEVIGFLHAHDVYAHPDVLARVMQAFEAGAEVVYGDLQYVREGGDGAFKVVRHWRSGPYQARQLAWGWMPPHPALFVRRDLYERVALDEGLYFDPAYRCAGDYDFILRLFTHLTTPPVYLPEVLVRMRTGGVSNRSLAHILRKSREDWRAIRRNRVGGMHTLISKNVRKVGQFRV